MTLFLLPLFLLLLLLLLLLLPLVKPDLPENYEADTWRKLREVTVAVQLQRSISYSLEELYQAVENMCSHKMAANLYSNLKVECDRHVQSIVSVFERYPFCCETRLYLVYTHYITLHHVISLVNHMTSSARHITNVCSYKGLRAGSIQALQIHLPVKPV